MEGWAAASLRPSVLSAAVLRYQDLLPAAAVSGEVATVEAFGLLVKLGEGVRALVPKNHLADVTVKNPKARFKVLLCDEGWVGGVVSARAHILILMLVLMKCLRWCYYILVE